MLTQSGFRSVHLNAAPLTIVQLTTSGNQSGGTRQLLVLARGLKERGHRVMLLAKAGSAALRWAQEAGLESAPIAFRGLRGKWAASRALRAVAKEVGADVVHAHHTQAHNIALLATFGGGFPPVVVNRGVVYRPEFPAKFRTSRTAAIVTNSEAAKAVLVKARVPAGKIHVVYNAKEAADPETLARRAPALRSELSLDGGGPIVGAVGGGTREKGFTHLVEAAPRILAAYPEALFVLVGSGMERFAPRIQELGLATRFRLTGGRPDAVDLMAAFDVFVLPSLFESCPNVLLEAQGVGVPTVCSNVGGVPEILEGGRLGRLVPPADPAALSAAVCDTLAALPAARERAGLAREAMIRRFSLANKVDGTLAVYRGLLAGRPRR